MSVSFLPGYDFTYAEMLTSEKLRVWIGGMKNTDILTAGDVGLSAEDTGIGLNTSATWNSGVSIGALTFNTSTGLVEVTNKWGQVPVFGTQGGLFTNRLRDDRTATGDAFAFLFAGNNPLTICPEPGLSATLPAANYTLGTGYDCFAGNDIVGSCMGANYTLQRAGKTYTRYPNEARHSVAGAYTADSCVSLAAAIHSLYKVGGVDALRYDLEDGLVTAQLGYAITMPTAISGVTNISGLTGTNRAQFGFDPGKGIMMFGSDASSVINLCADSASNFTVYAQSAVSRANNDFGFDTDNNLVIVAGSGAHYMYAYTASTITQVGDVTHTGGANSRTVSIDTTRKIFLAGTANGSRISAFSYNCSTYTMTELWVHSHGETYVYGGRYDPDEDLHVITCYTDEMQFLRATASTVTELLAVTASQCRRPFILGNRHYTFSSAAGAASPKVFYLTEDHTTASIVQNPAPGLGVTADRGGGPHIGGTVVGTRGNNDAKLIGFANGCVTVYDTYALGSDGWGGGIGHAAFVSRYPSGDLCVFEGRGYGSIEATIAGGGSTTITGVAGSMSGNVWGIDSPASGATHPTPRRVHPNTQCMYETGSGKLSTGLVFPTLSTPREGFSRGGKLF